MRLTSLRFPGLSFWPFLKMCVAFFSLWSLERYLFQFPCFFKDDREGPCNDNSQFPQHVQLQPIWSLGVTAFFLGRHLGLLCIGCLLATCSSSNSTEKLLNRVLELKKHTQKDFHCDSR